MFEAQVIIEWGEEEIEIYDFANDSCRKERHTSEVSFYPPPAALLPSLLVFSSSHRGGGEVCNKTGLSFAGLEMLRGEAEGGSGGQRDISTCCNIVSADVNGRAT